MPRLSPISHGLTAAQIPVNTASQIGAFAASNFPNVDSAWEDVDNRHTLLASVAGSNVGDDSGGPFLTGAGQGQGRLSGSSGSCKGG